MQVKDAVVFITGANRGLGLAFARAALAGGARKVYAAARDPASVKLAGVTPIRLDVTDARQVAEAAAACGDVTLLVNNAGIARGSSVLASGAAQTLRDELETNVFGLLATSQAFAPVLAANGGGAIVNVLSALSWLAVPVLGTYSVTKSAAWGVTNSLRNELRAQGTQVLALHVGFMETDMAAGFPGDKASPADVARQVFEGLAAGQSEVLADGTARGVKASLSSAEPAYLQAR